jgi:outer membrane protein
MIRLKLLISAVVALLVSAPLLRAQLSKIAVVDFERAVVESAEGKKSSDKFNATVQAKQADIEKRQKDLDEAQKKLQNGARTLSDTAKTDIQRDIDRKTLELQRINEDAQKELQTLREELLRPIADKATAILNAMSAEEGYTIVVDVSNPETSVVWSNPKNEITAELIKRIDAAATKEPAKTEAPKTPGATPSTGRPTTPAPAPTAPKP